MDPTSKARADEAMEFQSDDVGAVPRLARTAVSWLAAATPDKSPARALAASDAVDPYSDSCEISDSFDIANDSSVLYLAYGSNMAAATFQGQRGVRPLSCVSVSAPALQLAFDLPGMPYREPCFANAAVRKVPGVPKLPPGIPKVPPEVPGPDPDKPLPVPSPPLDAFASLDSFGSSISSTPPLCGVVYEVTPEDYAHILATEGGGASYRDILVPCVALPPRVEIPENPPTVPRPFLAHTLWAPQIKDDDGDGDGDGDNDDDDSDNDSDGDGDDDWCGRLRGRLVRRLVRLAVLPPRPDPTYAQPSERYLGLLRDGAREHELPPAYQDWLATLTPYRPTTCRQRVAAALLLPLLLLIGLLMQVRIPGQSKDGRLPMWMLVVTGLGMRALWWTYDGILKPVFGDGERTIEGEEDRYGNDEKTPLRKARQWV